MKQDFTVELVGLHMVTPVNEVIYGNDKGANITLSTMWFGGRTVCKYCRRSFGLHEVFELLWRSRSNDYSNDNLAIEFGDYIILDNCTTHRFQTGDALQRWLMHWERLLFKLDFHPSFM